MGKHLTKQRKKLELRQEKSPVKAGPNGKVARRKPGSMNPKKT